MNMHEFEKLVDDLIESENSLTITSQIKGGYASRESYRVKRDNAKSALLSAYADSQWHERKEDGTFEPVDPERWIVIVYNESETHGCISGKYAKSILSGSLVKRWCYLMEDGKE